MVKNSLPTVLKSNVRFLPSGHFCISKSNTDVQLCSNWKLKFEEFHWNFFTWMNFKHSKNYIYQCIWTFPPSGRLAQSVNHWSCITGYARSIPRLDQLCSTRNRWFSTNVNAFFSTIKRFKKIAKRQFERRQNLKKNRLCSGAVPTKLIVSLARDVRANIM